MPCRAALFLFLLLVKSHFYSPGRRVARHFASRASGPHFSASRRGGPQSFRGQMACTCMKNQLTALTLGTLRIKAGAVDAIQRCSGGRERRGGKALFAIGVESSIPTYIRYLTVWRASKAMKPREAKGRSARRSSNRKAQNGRCWRLSQHQHLLPFSCFAFPSTTACSPAHKAKALSAPLFCASLSEEAVCALPSSQSSRQCPNELTYCVLCSRSGLTEISTTISNPPA